MPFWSRFQGIFISISSLFASLFVSLTFFCYVMKTLVRLHLDFNNENDCLNNLIGFQRQHKKDTYNWCTFSWFFSEKAHQIQKNFAIWIHSLNGMNWRNSSALFFISQKPKLQDGNQNNLLHIMRRREMEYVCRANKNVMNLFSRK